LPGSSGVKRRCTVKSPDTGSPEPASTKLPFSVSAGVSSQPVSLAAQTTTRSGSSLLPVTVSDTSSCSTGSDVSTEIAMLAASARST
jgi:hypothetical protein